MTFIIKCDNIESNKIKNKSKKRGIKNGKN